MYKIFIMVAIYYSFLLFYFCQSLVCLAVSSISSSEPLFLNQTLISPSQIFELGFFTPNGSISRYVGMWYKNFPTRFIWVANRAQPLDYKDQLASLTVGGDGNLKLLDGARNALWSTNVSMGSNRSVAKLLDTGNLVLLDSGNTTWESFDFPTDTLLPGMKVEINVKTKEKRYLISWKTNNDPSPGNFIGGITSEIPPQPFIWNGSTPYWRGGQWDKSNFIGTPGMQNVHLSAYNVYQDIQQGTTYYTLSTYRNDTFTYMFISSEGSVEWVLWIERDQKWLTIWEAPRDLCETYGTCGPFGVCDTSASSICKCLEGFTPKSEEEWKRGNWTGGCRRKKELQCQKDLNSGASLGSGTDQADYFLKLSQMKLPDTANYVPLLDENVGGCHTWCSNNCSCIAYSYVDNIGCLTWFNEVMDIRTFKTNGKDLFLRLEYNERRNNTGATKKIIAISLTTTLGCIVLGAGMYYVTCKGRANGSAGTSRNTLLRQIGKDEKDEVSSELPIFDFKSILDATSNFSIRNKLGQGGFGPVYMGRLRDGKEVAVKRLSSSSGQGMEEFKNEIILISKLQHRNLVKLMGCCIEGEEKILVYEYLPNKSLDTFLFDPSRNGELPWEKRFDIIQGIARGLLYLHRDSCLRVIHRDLKASNILLDRQMNPKISDFGLARMFQATQELVNTRRVMGTFGYMAPEYAMGGTFSEKSDVYSFGVLMLEIISGKRNANLCYLGRTLNLLSYAWQLWREGRGSEFADEAISADYVASLQEITKCVQIGLLCTQDQPMDRPNMRSVVYMLSGKLDLPDPRPPTLTSFHSPSSDHEIHSQQEAMISINTMTLTSIQGR